MNGRLPDTQCTKTTNILKNKLNNINMRNFSFQDNDHLPAEPEAPEILDPGVAAGKSLFCVVKLHYLT